MFAPNNIKTYFVWKVMIDSHFQMLFVSFCLHDGFQMFLISNKNYSVNYIWKSTLAE